ncbi:glycosyltransferase, partial [Photobacterium phosphoreum]|uniref:glycosyltransferase n=1 Tax=Photobacterium phosphoreum TaxID=659 RepID=UPI0011B22920
MKTLLIGEASGVHRNLKKGLINLGCDVEHYVNYSEGYQNRTYDNSFSKCSPGLWGGLRRNIEPYYNILKLDNYDVINFTNTITAVHGKYSKYKDLGLIRKKAKILSYYGVGCDEIGIIRRSNIDLKYSPCHGCLSSNDTLSKDCEKLLNNNYRKSVELVNKHFDVLASSMIEYDHIGSIIKDKNFGKIPLPVDVESIKYQPYKLKNKLNIVHAPTRRGFKGSDVIIRAINKLSKVRNDFNFKIIENVSYERYLDIMNNADIVIDQVYSQSPGMSALEMMSAGKIVFTGSTEPVSYT